MNRPVEARCPICAAAKWREHLHESTPAVLWVCQECETVCRFEPESGVMVQVPVSYETVLYGSADREAWEALGAKGYDESKWAEANRAICDLLHRRRPPKA